MNAFAAQRWPPVAAAALAAFLVGALGAAATDLSPWYQALAMSGVLGWTRAPNARCRVWMLGLFALNGGLNIFWSALFFHLQRPDLALVEVGFLWLSVALLALHLRSWSRTASLLLLPYLAWVAFAAWLNMAIVEMNGPFVAQ